MMSKKTIALVAHDNRKQDLVEWVGWNFETIVENKLISTGTTGKIVKKELRDKLKDNDMKIDFTLKRLKSGPLGGDQQLGALIVDGKIDIFIFFWDPMQPHPHDVDVKALLRIAVLYNIPMACDRATADFMISSPLFNEKYKPIVKNYSDYVNREV